MELFWSTTERTHQSPTSDFIVVLHKNFFINLYIHSPTHISGCVWRVYSHCLLSFASSKLFEVHAFKDDSFWLWYYFCIIAKRFFYRLKRSAPKVKPFEMHEIHLHSSAKYCFIYLTVARKREENIHSTVPRLFILNRTFIYQSGHTNNSWDVRELLHNSESLYKSWSIP